jgi:uncharacterized protein YlaI
MRAFENLLTPGSTELPECKCGADMRLFKTKPLEDTEIRIFRCDSCYHEFQLMVWKTEEVSVAGSLGFSNHKASTL